MEWNGIQVGDWATWISALATLLTLVWLVGLFVYERGRSRKAEEQLRESEAAREIAALESEAKSRTFEVQLELTRTQGAVREAELHGELRAFDARLGYLQEQRDEARDRAERAEMENADQRQQLMAVIEQMQGELPDVAEAVSPLAIGDRGSHSLNGSHGGDESEDTANGGGPKHDQKIQGTA